jgi:hypothetical protein
VATSFCQALDYGLLGHGGAGQGSDGMSSGTLRKVVGLPEVKGTRIFLTFKGTVNKVYACLFEDWYPSHVIVTGRRLERERHDSPLTSS